MKQSWGIKGTGLAWDAVRYDSALCNGLHIFNPGDRVQNEDGSFGQVVSRTALYAQIHWAGSLESVEVAQFLTTVTVV